MKQITREVVSSLGDLQKKLNGFFASLPRPIREGLWNLSAEDTDLLFKSAEALSVYLLHQTDSIDRHMAKISEAILKDPFSEHALLGDRILEEYQTLRLAIQHSLTECHRVRQNSPQELWSSLRQLMQASERFCQFLLPHAM